MSDETVDEAVVIDEGIVLEARVQQRADRMGRSSVMQRTAADEVVVSPCAPACISVGCSWYASTPAKVQSSGHEACWRRDARRPHRQCSARDGGKYRPYQAVNSQLISKSVTAC